MMRTAIFYFLLFFLLPYSAISQPEEEELLYIEWPGDDAIANELVGRGIRHFINIENEKAYTYFEGAVNKDPSLFAPHVVLAWLSTGEKKAYHTAEAKRLVEDKNEPSKLFVSLLDVPDGEGAQEKSHALWKKMHEVAHDGQFIHFYYALSMNDPKAQIAELENLIEKSQAKERNHAHIHNILGYLYYGEGEKEKAKSHFETYLEKYPEGYNPYDSMGEYYLNEGDLEKALSHYKKAVEMYPPAVNANNKIEEIEKKMDERGNLFLVTSEYVTPGHMEDYIQWGKEYKAAAEKANFRTFWVAAGNGKFRYASNIGKSISGLDEFEKEWEEWAQTDPEVAEQYKKYKHTISRVEKELWRHSPEYSYRPENYENNDPNTYVRTYHGYVQFGSEDAVKALLAEFKAEWEKHQISQPYNVFWNVFGKEDGCVNIRTVYKNREAWLAEMKEVREKVGEEKLNDLGTRWNNLMRRWEEHELYPQPELTHIQN